METGPIRLSIQLGFPRGTLVCPGVGERREIEYWMLLYLGEQRQDDWNYWIVIECLQPQCKWEVTRIVPWWSRYGWHWDTEPGARRGAVSDGNVLHLGEPLPDVSDPRLTTPRTRRRLAVGNEEIEILCAKASTRSYALKGCILWGVSPVYIA